MWQNPVILEILVKLGDSDLKKAKNKNEISVGFWKENGISGYSNHRRRFLANYFSAMLSVPDPISKEISKFCRRGSVVIACFWFEIF